MLPRNSSWPSSFWARSLTSAVAIALLLVSGTLFGDRRSLAVAAQEAVVSVLHPPDLAELFDNATAGLLLKDAQAVGIIDMTVSSAVCMSLGVAAQGHMMRSCDFLCVTRYTYFARFNSLVPEKNRIASQMVT